MKKYEGLFILNLAGVEDSVNDAIDRVSKVLADTGAKVENIQKMEKKPFSRAVDKHVTSGYYVNILFDAAADVVEKIHTAFERDKEVWRVLITKVPKSGPAKIAA